MLKLILNFTFIFLAFCTVSAQNWFPLGSGTNGEVMALTEYNNELIVGGNFIYAGGINSPRLAKWNGTSWSAFAVSYPGAFVSSLLKFDNDLIATGFISLNSNFVQKWNGLSWSVLGGSNGYCGYRLIVYNNQLIAAGTKVTQGGDTVNYIAKWNGTNWQPLGSGLNEPAAPVLVNAMVVYNNELIVGGYFKIAGGVNARGVAKWNGANWSPLGSGIQPLVYSLAVYNNQLIAGGDFDTAGGIIVNKIAKWNGTGWSSLGSGMSGSIPQVRALIVLNNDLIAAGSFSAAGGVNAPNIAKWNGTNWSTVGSGILGTSYPNVSALALYNNNIFAGGQFYGAGIYLANNIAHFGTGIGVKKISQDIPEKFLLKQNYPNPFNPSTNIRYQIPDKKYVTIKIFDLLGKEVVTLVNEKLSPGTYEVPFNGSNLASGVYYYTLSAGDIKETKRMVLVK